MVESSEHEESEYADQSDESGTRTEVDAMGREKRRQVIGGQYGATVRKQLTVYGIFIAFVLIVGIGFLTVVSGIDNRDMPLEDTAPWTEASADQSPPRPVDFPCNGPTNTIPADEIGEAVDPSESDPLATCGASAP